MVSGKRIDNSLPKGEGCYECNLPTMELPLSDVDGESSNKKTIIKNVPVVQNKLLNVGNNKKNTAKRMKRSTEFTVRNLKWVQASHLYDHIHFAAVEENISKSNSTASGLIKVAHSARVIRNIKVIFKNCLFVNLN